MFSLANQILDAYDDVNREEFVKIAQVYPKLNVMTSDERSQLGDHDFALSIITKTAGKMNKFPIKSAHDTFLSGVYFEKNGHKLPEEAQITAGWNIKEACKKFGLKAPKKVATITKEAKDNTYFEPQAIKAVAAIQKTASMNEMAEAQKIATNHTFAQYAFSTPDHVKMGTQYFEKFASKMPLEVRHGYAESLQKRARELGMEPIKGEVRKYASDYYNAMVDAHLRGRASLVECQDPKFEMTLKKMASLKATSTPSEFAKALHSFDKAAGLEQYYGGYITDPYQATFASEPNTPGKLVKTASGVEVSEAQMREIGEKKLGKVAEYFGKHIADEFKKDPVTIFESLPNDAKEILAGISNGTL